MIPAEYRSYMRLVYAVLVKAIKDMCSPIAIEFTKDDNGELINPKAFRHKFYATAEHWLLRDNSDLRSFCEMCNLFQSNYRFNKESIVDFCRAVRNVRYRVMEEINRGEAPYGDIKNLPRMNNTAIDYVGYSSPLSINLGFRWYKKYRIEVMILFRKFTEQRKNKSLKGAQK